MDIDQPVLEGRFLRRYKRFFADVELEDGQLITAHCPNTGSLAGCLVEGAPAVLRDSQNPDRKLRHTWQSIQIDGTWVNVDTSLPNALVAAAIDAGEVPELAGYESLRREVKYGEGSRIDILLEGPSVPCWVEVKSTTLVEDGVARFPDAVTARGKKHLGELLRMAQAGDRAVMFFAVARDDVEVFAPADAIDPAYGEELRRVMTEGVEAFAYTTTVEPGRIRLGRRVPIDLGL